MDGGLSIGLFGGSFNPAHSGHLHVAERGLQQLDLDRIWWMVSPQNPLKPTQPPYEDRVQSVKALGLPPRMEISHMEVEFGTRYTAATLKRAKIRWPQHRFVFMMGTDNLAQLPQWKDWRYIMETVPIAVIARPGQSPSETLRARLSLAARAYGNARVPEFQSHILAWCAPPAWTYITTPFNALSSSAIRANRKRG